MSLGHLNLFIDTSIYRYGGDGSGQTAILSDARLLDPFDKEIQPRPQVMKTDELYKWKLPEGEGYCWEMRHVRQGASDGAGYRANGGARRKNGGGEGSGQAAGEDMDEAQAGGDRTEPAVMIWYSAAVGVVYNPVNGTQSFSHNNTDKVGC
jgi:hypothetical protein